MKPALLLPALLFLSACMTDPVVSDFNGSSVKLQVDALAEPVRNDASDAEATRICKAGGKKRAEYASTRSLPSYTYELLYLCLG